MSVWGENPDQSPMLNPDGSETVNPGTASAENTAYSDTASASVLMTALVQDGVSLADSGSALIPLIVSLSDGVSMGDSENFNLPTGKIAVTFSATTPRMTCAGAKPNASFEARKPIIAMS